MTEKSVLVFHCEKCKKKNFPYGRFVMKDLPYVAKLKCKECGHMQQKKWLSNKLHEETIKKKMGLGEYHKSNSSNSELISAEMGAMKADFDALKANYDVLRQSVDLIIKKQLQEVGDEFRENHSDHNFIQSQITSLRDEITYAKKFGKFKADE